MKTFKDFLHLFRARNQIPLVPDVNPRAHRIRDYYGSNFQTLVRYDTPEQAPWHESMEEVREWCKSNLQGKYRFDIHRTWVESNGDEIFNDIGGLDRMYAAFELETDAAYFRLRWS